MPRHHRRPAQQPAISQHRPILPPRYLLSIMLGQVLRINRESGPWTQEKLADLSGCTSSYISEIENGRADLSIKMADRLCQAMTVSTGCLVYEAEILAQQFRLTEPHYVYQNDWADPNVARQWLIGEHIRSLSKPESFLTEPATPWLLPRGPDPCQI